MKTTILLLPCMLLLSMSAFAQKKSKLSKDEQIDSLTTANARLATHLDSMTKQVAVYQGMYAAVKEKVIKYDFAPERTSELIDSLKAGRDKTFSTLSSDAKALNDSLTVLTAKNAELKAKADALEAEKKNNETVVAGLRELKSLLDEKAITQEEYEARKAKVIQGW